MTPAERQLKELLKEYHPGARRLDEVQQRYPQAEAQLPVLRLMQAFEIERAEREARKAILH